MEKIIEKFDNVENSLNTAIKLASIIHSKDAWGVYPYFVHLALVDNEVGNCRNIGLEIDEMRKLAWLHDTIEDHPEYYEIILKLFPNLINPLLLVSRKENESYNEYIDRLIFVDYSLDAFDPVYMDKLKAMYIKLCDLTVNMENNPSKTLLKRYILAKEKVSNSFSELLDFIQNR